MKSSFTGLVQRLRQFSRSAAQDAPTLPPAHDAVTAEFARPITLTINGEVFRVNVATGRTLLDLLRYDLGLTGTKENCRMGSCGACTVLIDGRAIKSCLTLTIRLQGKHIQTVEGLINKDGSLDPLQQAFVQQAGFQCGYCTPGFLMMSKEILDTNPSPSEDEIREGLVGNICRCTGYGQIIEAVLAASRIQVVPEGKSLKDE